jgi:hypothetical protein
MSKMHAGRGGESCCDVFMPLQVRKSTGAQETAKQNKKARAREVREAEEQQQQQARSMRLARQRATPTEEVPQAWHVVGHPAAAYVHPGPYGYPMAAQIGGRHTARVRKSVSFPVSCFCPHSVRVLLSPRSAGGIGRWRQLS